jgi:hypothetical protein
MSINWISGNTPKKKGTYLVTLKPNRIEILSAEFLNDQWQWRDHSNHALVKDAVLAWAPLPKPYKPQIRKKMVGFFYDDQGLNGWRIGTKDMPKDRYTWVLTDDLRRCISRNRILCKWSIIGTRTLMWHPREVREWDFSTYDPPEMPQGLELKYEEKTV